MNSLRAKIAMQALALVLAQGAVVLPAWADTAPPRADTVSRKVHVGDLDLSTASGRHALDRRLKRAAWHVCTVTAPSQGPSRMEHGLCIKTLAGAARREVYAARRASGPLVAGDPPR